MVWNANDRDSQRSGGTKIEHNDDLAHKTVSSKFTLSRGCTNKTSVDYLGNWGALKAVTLFN